MSSSLPVAKTSGVIYDTQLVQMITLPNVAAVIPATLITPAVFGLFRLWAMWQIVNQATSAATIRLNLTPNFPGAATWITYTIPLNTAVGNCNGTGNFGTFVLCYQRMTADARTWLQYSVDLSSGAQFFAGVARLDLALERISS